MIFVFLQIASLWHSVTTALALCIMFHDSPRQGVVQHLTIGEYRAMSRRKDANVLWVLKHKVGDKSAANLVLEDQFAALMDR